MRRRRSSVIGHTEPVSLLPYRIGIGIGGTFTDIAHVDDVGLVEI